MDTNFYKELHNRELTRARELDNSITMPIGVVTLLMSLLSIIFKENKALLDNCLILVLFMLIAILLFITCVFLIRSMNNFFMNHEMKNIAYADELFNYENEVAKYNDKSYEKTDIELILKERYAILAGHNKRVNDKRSNNLYYAKNCLIFAVMISLLLILIYFFKTL
ncbi:hypothetical protein HMPREF9713_01134 [Myroides odoratimimus CCUG 12700]|uniref:hypothetical protein n=1 Tax=Myroides odoratimimus TaxID=76832 RepID=UPI000353D953|nr:hypothetical protein [Myroides odoratimimus]EPH12293.1 hypothetical protein HMPREF9713_01134 [Myroides odoratimimus CCUG 12700]